MQKTEIATILVPEKKEIISYTPINNLYILVHPLNEEYGKTLLVNNHTRRARAAFFDAAITHFTPHVPNDVLVLLPDADPSPKEFRKKVTATKTHMELFDDPHSWISIYNEIEKKAVSTKNVMLGENVPEISIPSEAIEERLRGKGFRIASDTQIYIGGELTENCVVDTAMDFLSLAQVSKVFIDRHVSIGLTDYPRHTLLVPISDVVAAERLHAYGYHVRMRSRYIEVRRP